MRSPVSGGLLLSLAALSIPARSPFSVMFSWSRSGFEQDRFDQRSDGPSRARAALLALQRRTEVADLLAIDVGRVRVQQLRYLRVVPYGAFAELRRIVLKTVALAEPLRTALKPLSSSIRAAFVYGSVAKATDRATSDIDLMIVSDSLMYADLFGVLEHVTKTLGGQVNPTVHTAAEVSRRSRQESAFVRRVLEQPKVWIIGGEDDLPVAA